MPWSFQDTPWVQLLRTNGSALHPMFFGIYGNVVYHHGAGFRDNALPVPTVSS